ncbi:MAG: DMT family transporter [Actinobacteria bacterium]|nr:MAG: DMT family transporter [Actinomycetota bacterium]
MNTSHAKSSDTQAGFGFLDWILSLGMALTWGSSFLLIDIAIRHFQLAVIPFGRTGFGVVALLLLPSARHRVAREHWPRLIVLGFVWMAMPFLLYPLAEQTVSTSITGMMNGALPVVVAVVTALWIRTMPSSRRMFAVLIGFCGILLIALPSIKEGSAADTKGILYLVAALLSYAVAINIARPLQATYTPGTLMLHVEIVAFVMSAPLGLWGITRSSFSISSFAALVVLGVLGTGFAFVLFATLSKRTGAVRSMIPTYFTPIVGTILGTTFNNEPLLILSAVGMFVVIVGAYLMSKPDSPSIN